MNPVICPDPEPNLSPSQISKYSPHRESMFGNVKETSEIRMRTAKHSTARFSLTYEI